MKYKLFILALTFSLSVCMPDAQAGFWVKKQAAAATITHGKGQTPATFVVGKTMMEQAMYNRFSDNRYPKHRDNSGWEGSVSLGCGILGIFLFFPAIPAIIFGIKGLNHQKKYRGIALAGLIVGIIDILIWATAAVIFLIMGGIILV